MAGSDRAKKPGMILHVPSTEARARRRAVNAGGWLPKRVRRRPDDFLEVATRVGNHRNTLRHHYGANAGVVERWAREVGLALVKMRPDEMVKKRAAAALPREFDMALDGDRWRAMQGAMTLNGRAVRGEVWRKEARGEYD